MAGARVGLMSLEDPRHVRPELQRVPVEEDDIRDDADDEGPYDVYEEDPAQTEEEREELHRTLMAELRQRLADIDEGRTQPIPWDEEAELWMFEEDF